ncbi:ninja-family protein 1-like isoform X2 [Durio zibethinus]|uniref:Ninja-family protein n=1 Tax=Durio zibethinus TaxID=66656 RepID=A0A6P5XKL7_DURZI|nr:ninja-family protein 1-like isoform X2 [Durio zibethinus]
MHKQVQREYIFVVLYFVYLFVDEVLAGSFFLVFEMENDLAIMGLGEDEIELELGLSIGGSFRKAEKLKPIKKESKPKNNSVADIGESVVFYPQTKREIQALRRQEAKKKREEKQQKRGTIISSICHQNEFRSKVDDVGATEERECKKNKVQEFSGNANLKTTAELNNPLGCPVIPLRVPSPYPQVQFLPLDNRFAYSCANGVPCWGGGVGNEKSVVQPVAPNGAFWPFQTGQDSGVNAGNGYDSEQNSSRDERNRKTGSNGSPMYSSSVVSDLECSSNQGGCSSEAGTGTSHCQLEHPQMNCSVASNLKGQSEHSAPSHQMDSAQSIDKSRNGIEKKASMKVTESTPSSLKEEPNPRIRSDFRSKPVLTNETPAATLTKDAKGDMGKPPKPQIPPGDILSLQNMPCVSTTGNGPNGKTINGFLYRYTKSEVSIICVCHGSSFTPAEFVQHAGGDDVSHPLRHITVIPSAF